MIILPQGTSWAAYALVLVCLTVFTLVLAFRSNYLTSVLGHAQQTLTGLVISLFDI